LVFSPFSLSSGAAIRNHATVIQRKTDCRVHGCLALFRSRACQCVSALPIDWDELAEMKGAHPFDISDADTLRDRAKTLKGWGFTAQSLPDV
jgi:hypothetical protein